MRARVFVWNKKLKKCSMRAGIQQYCRGEENGDVCVYCGSADSSMVPSREDYIVAAVC